MTLKILALNCTLKPEGQSSTHRILELALDEFPDNCKREIVRVAALNIKPGVSSDEGKGDDWPGLRRKIDACDILLIGTPRHATGRGDAGLHDGSATRSTDWP